MTSIRKNHSDILFVDIETVSRTNSYEELSPEFKKLWIQKVRIITREDKPEPELIKTIYREKAGIYSEFARIVCISVGVFSKRKKKNQIFKVKSFYNEDERILLKNFCQLLNDHFNNLAKHSICGHNIREFDIPFICRRLRIQNLDLPRLLNISGKKPWEVNHLLDTLVLWKFGDYKNFSSLHLLATVLGVETSKDDIDGSQVHDIYYQENDIKRIVTYCEKDVLCTASVYMRLTGKEIGKDLIFKSQSLFN